MAKKKTLTEEEKRALIKKQNKELSENATSMFSALKNAMRSMTSLVDDDKDNSNNKKTHHQTGILQNVLDRIRLGEERDDD